MGNSERQIEMLWRCSSCQHKNLGRFKSCKSCGNPKDGSEEYEMPEDTANAATVTEADLLRMATAGPDWRCAYCGSDQRRLDMGCGNCGASAVEGAEVPDTNQAAPLLDNPSILDGGSWAAWKWVVLSVPAVLVLFAGLGAFLSWNRNRPRD